MATSGKPAFRCAQCGLLHGSSQHSLKRKIDPDRNVVGRLFPAAHVLVDAARDEPVGGLWREQHMVDANSVVLLPGTGLIVPECVGAWTVTGDADRVGQSEIA